MRLARPFGGATSASPEQAAPTRIANLGIFASSGPSRISRRRLMTNRRAIPRRLNGAAAPDCIAAKLRPLEFTAISLMLR